MDDVTFSSDFDVESRKVSWGNCILYFYHARDMIDLDTKVFFLQYLDNGWIFSISVKGSQLYSSEMQEIHTIFFKIKSNGKQWESYKQGVSEGLVLMMLWTDKLYNCYLSKYMCWTWHCRVYVRMRDTAPAVWKMTLRADRLTYPYCEWTRRRTRES